MSHSKGAAYNVNEFKGHAIIAQGPGRGPGNELSTLALLILQCHKRARTYVRKGNNILIILELEHVNTVN